MIEKITIRNVKNEDLEIITEIELECFPKEEAATKESLQERIKTFPNKFWIAEYKGKGVGFINGCVTNSHVIFDELYTNSLLHIEDGDYQAVFGLDVIPNYQGKGIAKLLMNTLIEETKSAGKKGVILTCKENLIPFYEKFGFRNKGISESAHGGVTWYDMVLDIR